MSDDGAEPRRLPVTVIGGYLGAGKTTLITRLIATEAGADSIVLVNDFGELGLDASLLNAAGGDAIELANGCICCSLAAGLAVAIDQVRTIVAERGDAGPRRMLIEASGVADPGAVAQYARLPGFELAACIGVLDAATAGDLLTDPLVGSQVAHQLSRCDLVVLTKLDLCADGGSAARSAAARHIGEGVAVLDGPGDDADLAELLAATPVAGPPEPSSAMMADRWSRWSWSQGDTAITRSQVERFLAEMGPVARCKGAVAIDEATHLIVQAVGKRHELTSRNDWPAGQPPGLIAIDPAPDLATSAAQAMATALAN